MKIPNVEDFRFFPYFDDIWNFHTRPILIAGFEVQTKSLPVSTGKILCGNPKPVKFRYFHNQSPMCIFLSFEPSEL